MKLTLHTFSLKLFATPRDSALKKFNELELELRKRSFVETTHTDCVLRGFYVKFRDSERNPTCKLQFGRGTKFLQYPVIVIRREIKFSITLEKTHRDCWITLSSSPAVNLARQKRGNDSRPFKWKKWHLISIKRPGESTGRYHIEISTKV